MTDLPTGTVTFLFTDIEGSTRLLQELGDAYGDLLQEHHRLMRDVFSRHGGNEVGTEGDAFFVVFSSVPDAVNAAAEAQRRLGEHSEKSGIELRVRMGLHTGHAEMVGDNYGGLDVHRAARISSAAHGGQVLLSAATSQHVRGSPRISREIRVRDLGEFRLKDLDSAEQLSQLCVDGLRTDFPPPRTLDSPVDLPALRDPFIARDREMGGVRELLRGNRLVTLTGPGGTGKTRLAIETARSVAGNFLDGVFFVELAALTDAALVATTIADALSVREEGTRPVVETLKEYFSRKRMLLLLDNFEQIVSAAPLVSELLTAAPDITMLVTSRAPLRIAGEQEYPVPSMTLPDPERLPDPEGLSAYDAVELFMQRARAVRPDFELTADNAPAVARICVKLDGLPLAIELAAARIRLLSPQDILTRLDRSLSLLSRGARDAPHRQQTLMNAIEWSYRLLDEDRQALFRRLAVFVGGWTLEAANAICDPDGKLTVDILDGLESLVTNSLVQVRHQDDGDTRFVMLRTIREFALEALSEDGELAELSQRHAAHFVEMAQTAEARIFDENEDWPDRLGLEHDNLRAALRHLMDSRDPRNGLALASSLWRFWQIRSHLAEGRWWLAEFLALPESDSQPALRAKALNAIGGLTYWQNDFEVTRTYYEEALDLYRSLGDRRGIGESLYNNGFLLLINREPQRARALYEESMSVYRELDDELGVAFAKWGLAMSFFQERDTHAARRFGLESHETFARLENWFGRSLSDYVLVQVDRIAGNYEGARQKLMVQLLEEPELLKDISSFSSYLEVLADLEIATGHVRRGLKLASGASTLRTEYGGGAPPPLLDLEDPKELARGALSPAEIDAAWEEGARFSLDEILTYARKDPGADE